MTHPDSRPYLWMLGGSFAFTLMAVFAHALTAACDWQAVAVARAGLVAGFGLLIAYLAGAKLVFLRPWRLWVRSVAGSCSMVCTFYAFDKLPVADVLTLANTGPIWIALLSWPLYGRPPGWKMAAAIAVGVVGVVLVEQPHLAAGNWGVVAALGAAVFSAVAMLGLHALRGIDPRAIVVHFSAVATLVCVGAYLVGASHGVLKHDPAGLVAAPVVVMMTGMAVAATVGQLFLTRAFADGAPAKVSVVGLTQIVMALAFDYWLWDHPLNRAMLVGIILVIAPTVWLLTRPAAADVHDRDPGEPPPAAVRTGDRPAAADRPTPSLRPR